MRQVMITTVRCTACADYFKWHVRKASFVLPLLPKEDILALTFEPTYSRSRLQMNVFSWRTWAATCICIALR